MTYEVALLASFPELATFLIREAKLPFHTVMTDRPCPALEAVADEARIPFVCIERSLSASSFNVAARADFTARTVSSLKSLGNKFVVTMDYMTHFTQDMFHPDAYKGRVINGHRSLLPKYPGYRPIRQAMDEGELVTGCTLHWSIPMLDAGPVIDRARTGIGRFDTEESVRKRIIELECNLYPRHLEQVFEQKMRLAA